MESMCDSVSSGNFISDNYVIIIYYYGNLVIIIFYGYKYALKYIMHTILFYDDFEIIIAM